MHKIIAFMFGVLLGLVVILVFVGLATMVSEGFPWSPVPTWKMNYIEDWIKKNNEPDFRCVVKETMKDGKISNWEYREIENAKNAIQFHNFSKNL